MSALRQPAQQFAAKPIKPFAVCLPNKFVQAGACFGRYSRVMYALLLSYKGKNDVCWPSIRQLAGDLRIHNETAMKYLNRLETEGLITRLQTPGENTQYRIPSLDFSMKLARIEGNFGGEVYVDADFLRNPDVPIAAKEFAMIIKSCQNGEEGYFGGYPKLMKLVGASCDKTLTRTIEAAKAAGVVAVDKNDFTASNIYFFRKVAKTIPMSNRSENAGGTVRKMPVGCSENAGRCSENAGGTVRKMPVGCSENAGIISNTTKVQENKVQGIKGSTAEPPANADDRRQAPVSVDVDSEKKEKKKPAPAAKKEPAPPENPPNEIQYLGAGNPLPPINRKHKNPCWTPFLELYHEFHFQEAEVPINFTGKDRAALQRIIAYLKKVVSDRHLIEHNERPDAAECDELAVAAWKKILDSWHVIDPFYQDKIQLSKIQSNISDIIKNIKDHYNGKSNTKARGRATLRRLDSAASLQRVHKELEEDWD